MGRLEGFFFDMRIPSLVVPANANTAGQKVSTGGSICAESRLASTGSIKYGARVCWYGRAKITASDGVSFIWLLFSEVARCNVALPPDLNRLQSPSIMQNRARFL